MADNPYRSPRANVGEGDATAGSDASKPEPEGLGGWLILVAIGLIVSVVRVSALVFVTFVPIFTTGQWGKLTSPGSDLYHPMWAPLLVFEILGNLVFVLMALTLLYLFFTKSRWFPRTFIAYLLLNVGFVAVDAFAGNFIPAIAAASDPETVKEIGRSVIGAAIWVPYMLMSKRVKNTFLRTRPAPAEAASAVTGKGGA